MKEGAIWRFLRALIPYPLQRLDPIYECPYCGKEFIIRGYLAKKINVNKKG